MKNIIEGVLSFKKDNWKGYFPINKMWTITNSFFSLLDIIIKSFKNIFNKI